MHVAWGRIIRLLISATGVMLLAAWQAGAQEPEKKTEPARTPEELIGQEGRFRLREDYFALRRRNPTDPSFDTAKARFRAVRSRQTQKAAPTSGSGPISPAAWSSIGPGPINFGQTPTINSIPSDVSGRVAAIAIDPVDGSVYVGGAQGGVWKSTDNGATWAALTDSLGSLAIGSIAIDPASHTAGNATIYVGTGEGNGTCDSYGGVGIYKSTNSGATWTGPLGNAQFQNRGVVSIAVDRANPNHVLAASASGVFGVGCVLGPVLPGRGIYESNDGGASWTQRTAGNHRASVVLQDPFTPTTWWGALWFTGNPGGGDDGGLVKSVNNGLSWSQVGGTGGLPAVGSAWGRAYVSATVDNPTAPTRSVLYLGNGISSGRLFRSVDSGLNWTVMPAANGYCDGQCDYDLPVYVEPGDPNRVYVGGAGQSGASLPTLFMRSDNGGASFADKVRSPSTSTALHADAHFITSWPGQPNRIWVANDGGVWRSDDRGDTWVDVNAGLAITQFSGCDLHPTDPLLAYGGSQDNGTEGWQGLNNWKHLDFGDGGFALIDQGNPSNLVHTYFNQTNNLIGVGFTTGGFATTMGSYNGSFAPANGIAIDDRVLFYAPIHLDRGVSDTLYFGTNRLWRASNFFVTGGTGGEFSPVNAAQDLAPFGSSFDAVSAIETFANPSPGANAALIYTGSSNGHVFRTTNATAGPPTWTEVDVGGSALYVSDILVDPSDSNVVYQSRAGFSGAPGRNVRKSTDGGNTWNPAASGIPDIPVNALALDPVTANRIWAGTDVGVYVSSDGGANWVPYASRLPNAAVFDLKANATTKQLLACTHGRSAFVLSLDDDLIFQDGFESHDFANWSSVQNDGDLTITPAAAMGGSTVGMQATVNDTNSLFVQDDLPNNEPRYRTRLYLNPNTFDPGEASSHFRARVLIGFNAAGERLVTLVLKRQGGQYSIEGRVRRNDGTAADTGFIGISNAPHFIELDWVKALTGEANGTFRLYIDGAAQPLLTGVDNDGSGIDFARMGVLSLKAGASGTIYFDQFVSRRQNYNGPES